MSHQCELLLLIFCSTILCYGFVSIGEPGAALSRIFFCLFPTKTSLSCFSGIWKPADAEFVWKWIPLDLLCTGRVNVPQKDSYFYSISCVNSIIFSTEFLQATGEFEFWLVDVVHRKSWIAVTRTIVLAFWTFFFSFFLCFFWGIKWLWVRGLGCMESLVIPTQAAWNLASEILCKDVWNFIFFVNLSWYNHNCIICSASLESLWRPCTFTAWNAMKKRKKKLQLLAWKVKPCRTFYAWKNTPHPSCIAILNLRICSP